MIFQLVSKRAEMVDAGFYLFRQSWNDYWTYETAFLLVYVDSNQHALDIGELKIGQFSKRYTEEDPSTWIPESFETLGSDYFSLGQSDKYYEKLESLGSGLRTIALTALRDIALLDELYEAAERTQCARVSLFRSIPPKTVREQFRRLARGGARLTDYSFTYWFPEAAQVTPGHMQFDVVAESNPPSNIQVLIGRNGVGKTTLLDAMARSFVLRSSDNETAARFGSFSFSQESAGTSFANVVSVSFSAFDSFIPLNTDRDRGKGPLYEYVGLKKSISLRTARQQTKNLLEDHPAGLSKIKLKDLDDLGDEFIESIESICTNESTLNRWQNAVQLLNSDPVFASTGILDLISQIAGAEPEVDDLLLEDTLLSLRNVFNRLSSGHKIVLLTMTRLVELVSEKTLVLIDEPEAHLHPPLLSAFGRALSDLLKDRNGVSIVATHSPVILQEVPQSCVWILNRFGNSSSISRPRMETFAENVGVLTSEVFGLEVESTGFHQRLLEAAMTSTSYAEALSKFNGEVGDEGRIILESLSLESLERERPY